jgi:heterodisulfide reductase subunit A
MEIIPKRIGFVQCVDSLTKERGYCSRACCRKSMELALALLKKDPTTKIYFFVKEVMSYGENELLYRELRSRGALFFRYNEDNPLRIVNVNENKFVNVNESLLVHVYDPILSRDLEFALDLLVLAPGVDAPSFDVIGVDRDSFGFFVGLDTKFSPQETERAGLFVVGSGRMPMSFGEAWVDGMACAAQIVSYIVNESVPVRRARAYVSERKCVKCLLCVSACPYGARLYDDESNIVRVNEITCQGCGACAVFCPSQATDMVEFSASGVISAVMDLAIFG